MGSKVVNLKARGLYTQANANSLPAGALLRADNVVIDRDDVIQPRRGFSLATDIGLVGLDEASFRVCSYTGFPLIWYAGPSTGGFVLYNGAVGVGGSLPLPVGTFDNYRFAEAAKSLFITTGSGVYRKDAYDSANPVAAGLPRALDFDRTGPAATLVNDPGFLADGSEVAYRSVIGIKNSNGRLLRSAPSGRYVVSNTTGTSGWSAGIVRNVVLRIPLPSGLSTSHFVQVYRSGQVVTAPSIEPSDEMGQVYEAFLTSTDISNGYVEFTDVATDVLRGASLYTNPNQRGILQANTPPPLARDLALFKGSLFFANTHREQSIALALISGDATLGMQVGDTVRIGSETFTAVAGAPGAPFEFTLVNGASSASLNIERTVFNLINAINADSASYYAFYTSGPDDIPGRMLVQARSLSTAAFNVYSGSLRAYWEPQLPAAASATVVSSADSFEHGLAWSPTDEPDAVPLLNYTLVGRGDSPIRRIVALRDALIIFKADGIYRLTGDSPANWRVDILDGTVRILAPESAVALGNQVYALTDQGVVAVSESGVSVVSRAIEKSILDDVTAAGLSRVRQSAFAVSYESDRKFVLFLPSSDALATQAYTFNYVTQAWTRWASLGLGASGGIVASFDDRLYFTSTIAADDVGLYQERKARAAADYQDPGGASIATAWDWLETGGDPTTGKQFRELHVANTGAAFPSTTIGFTADSGSAQSVTFDPSLVPVDTARVLVPLEAARGKKLRVSVANSTNQNAWEVAGWTLLVRPYGDRGGR